MALYSLCSPDSSEAENPGAQTVVSSKHSRIFKVSLGLKQKIKDLTKLAVPALPSQLTLPDSSPQEDLPGVHKVVNPLKVLLDISQPEAKSQSIDRIMET